MVDFEPDDSKSPERRYHHHRHHQYQSIDVSPVEGFIASDHIPAAAAALSFHEGPLSAGGGFSFGASSDGGGGVQSPVMGWVTSQAATAMRARRNRPESSIADTTTAATPAAGGILLYRRSTSITLPRDSSPYYKAKVAENTRDYKGALYWHSVCIEKGIRATSAIMDVAGILNKFGREQEALVFMEKYKHLVPQDRYQGFKRLYDRVQFNICRPSQSLPRMLKVVFVPPRGIPPDGIYTGDPPQFHTAHALAIFGALEEGPLDMRILDRLFPNPEKIECLAVTEPEPSTGTQVAYVQFESQSSARKALMTEKVLSNITVCWPEQTSSVLPPVDEEGVVGINIVEDKDRCITSPFESSLVMYVVRCGWKPPPSETITSPRPSHIPKLEPSSSRASTSLSIQSPRRYEDSWETHPAGDLSSRSIVPVTSSLPLEGVESVPGTEPSLLASGEADTSSALMFSKKMITAMKLLDEFTGGLPSTSDSFAVAEGCESVGRFDLAFGLYADIAAEISVGDASDDAPRELIECVIRCAVIAAIWGGSFETGCRILDCIITTTPSLTFLTRAASNLTSVLSDEV